MATNAFFNNYNNFVEQQLIDDLVIESIKMFGVDIIYITRSADSRDYVLNEDDTPIYDETYEFETYVKNVDAFEGQGDFLSKFGLEIRDQMTLTVANRTFEKFVTRERNARTRPLEGDFIYFPLNEKIFKVVEVEHESVFYQGGTLQVFDMKCELAEYSGERFETGRDNIDTFFDSINTNSLVNANTGTLEGLGDVDPGASNLYFEQDGDSIIDFSEIDPFSETLDIEDNI